MLTPLVVTLLPPEPTFSVPLFVSEAVLVEAGSAGDSEAAIIRVQIASEIGNVRATAVQVTEAARPMVLMVNGKPSVEPAFTFQCRR